MKAKWTRSYVSDNILGPAPATNQAMNECRGRVGEDPRILDLLRLEVA
jgi:hypothetical protein